MSPLFSWRFFPAGSPFPFSSLFLSVAFSLTWWTPPPLVRFFFTLSFFCFNSGFSRSLLFSFFLLLQLGPQSYVLHYSYFLILLIPFMGWVPCSSYHFLLFLLIFHILFLILLSLSLQGFPLLLQFFFLRCFVAIIASCPSPPVTRIIFLSFIPKLPTCPVAALV